MRTPVSLARTQFATGLPGTRFGVIAGGREKTASASSTSPAPLTAVPQAVPVHQRRFRGFKLVSGAQKAENAGETVESFDQARRIVAQVEWEIEQQAARERLKNMRRWQPLLVPAELGTKPVQNVAGIDRLRRFFGL